LQSDTIRLKSKQLLGFYGAFMAINLATTTDVGHLVRAARKAQKLRQDDAAGAMGVSDMFLSGLENGAPGVRLDKLLQCSGYDNAPDECSINLSERFPSISPNAIRDVAATNARLNFRGANNTFSTNS